MATEGSGEGVVRETYVAALQHDLVEFEEDSRLAGVVRRPTGWFHAAVDENYPELGPPEALLAEVNEREADFKRRGMCEEGAHNAAWEEVRFEDRYRDYLESSEKARQALGSLADAVTDGETVVLVCFEGENKRCHRHELVDRLEAHLSR